MMLNTIHVCINIKLKFEIVICITCDDLRISYGIPDINPFIKDLTQNTTYVLRVASRNKAGLSDWFGPRNYTTASQIALGHSSGAGISIINPVIYTPVLFLVCSWLISYKLEHF